VARRPESVSRKEILMSKKQARGKQKQSRPEHKGRRNRKVMIVAAVVLSLGLTGVMLAQLRAARVASTTNAMLAAPVAPAPATFSPSSPSKEYIYAGGRLLATEEPSGGTTTTEPPTTDPGPNATPTPTPVPPAPIPAGGKHSLLLNGTNAYAQFNHTTALDITGALTVEAWVKYTPNTKYQEIVAKENYGSTGGGYALQITPTGKLRFVLYQAGNAFVTVVGATTIGAGEWHHVAGVFDGTSERRVYLDGLEDGNASSAGSAPAPCTGGLKIGRLSSSATFRFSPTVGFQTSHLPTVMAPGRPSLRR
jgi:Concanavalin A-like lectin/glucanases superfamily